MDTNSNQDFLFNVDDIYTYVVIDEQTYRWILKNIDYNYLLIIFTMSCIFSLVCCYKKPQHHYMLVHNAKPVTGEIIEPETTKNDTIKV